MKNSNMLEAQKTMLLYFITICATFIASLILHSTNETMDRPSLAFITNHYIQLRSTSHETIRTKNIIELLLIIAET